MAQPLLPKYWFVGSNGIGLLVVVLCQYNIKVGKTHLFQKKYFTQAVAMSCAETVPISSQNCEYSRRSTYMAAWNS